MIRSKFSPDEIKYIQTHYTPRHPQFGACALARRYNTYPSTITAMVRRGDEYGTRPPRYESFMDDQNAIDKCLSCELEECTNCLRKQYGKDGNK